MDYRKLISFGKGGYVISIPKSWVVENKLDKGSFILVENHEDSLMLTPKGNVSSIKETFSEILVETDGKRIDEIKRILISAYLKSYNQIVLKGEDLKNYLPQIENIARDLIALEIIESAKNKIVLKDFLDFSTIDLNQIFRKMDHLIRAMFNDILEGKYDDVGSRNDDVDRHFFLLFKAIKKGIRDTSSSKIFKVNTAQLFAYWNNALFLESIAAEIAKLVLIIKTNKIKGQTINKIIEIIRGIHQTFLSTMAAFYKDDANLAYSFSSKKSEIYDACNKLHEIYWKEKNVPIVLESLKRVAQLNHKILRRIYG
ncbi:hypothetical protein KY306_00985 [Candidatus Woesearchaeota archaeon]|nr:hypothetical protein [Candidatus Woesearchaeota archaeon]